MLPRAELSAIVDLAQPALIVTSDFATDSSLSDAPLDDRVANHWKATTSGGSTRRPKVILALEPALFSINSTSHRMQIGGEVLIPGPLYRNGPFMTSLRGLFAGNHVVIMERFDALEKLRLIERYRSDWVMFVPTMMHGSGASETERAKASMSRRCGSSPIPGHHVRPGLNAIGSIGSAPNEFTSSTAPPRASAALGLTVTSGWRTQALWGGRRRLYYQDHQAGWRRVRAGRRGRDRDAAGERARLDYRYIGAEARRIGEFEFSG